MRLSLLPWLIVPGLGQIHRGRSGTGILLFALFVLAADAWGMGLLLDPDRDWRGLAAAAAAAVWIVSAGHLIWKERRPPPSPPAPGAS